MYNNNLHMIHLYGKCILLCACSSHNVKCLLLFQAPGLPFDGQGLPQMPMNPEQCSLM